MVMALNPPEATRRLRVELKVDNQTQFVQFRVGELVAGDWQDTVADAFVTWLGVLLAADGLEGVDDKSQVDILSVQYADIGSLIFLPCTTSAVSEVQAGSSATATALTAGSLFSFSGRSIGGIARFFLRGFHFLSENSELSDYRYSSSEFAPIANAIDSLSDNVTGFGQYLVGSDNTQILYWKPYMNVSVSRRYINHVRSR
jgi:hypothetical protein